MNYSGNPPNIIKFENNINEHNITLVQYETIFKKKWFGSSVSIY